MLEKLGFSQASKSGGCLLSLSRCILMNLMVQIFIPGQVGNRGGESGYQSVGPEVIAVEGVVDKHCVLRVDAVVLEVLHAKFHSFELEEEHIECRSSFQGWGVRSGSRRWLARRRDCGRLGKGKLWGR